MKLKAVVLFFCTIFSLLAEEKSLISQTYYDYSSQELDLLKSSHSLEKITKESLQKWDLVVTHLLQSHPLIQKLPYRIYAYLYTAQRDAAFLSYQTHEEFQGSLDQLNLMILRLFFPDFKPTFPIIVDAYSQKLAEIVFSRYQKRFISVGGKVSDPNKLSVMPWTGIYREYELPPRVTPWVVSPLIGKILTPPSAEDTAFWEKQLLERKKNKKKYNVKLLLQGFWITYKPVDYLNWVDIGNLYIFSHDVPLQKIFLFRSILTIGLYDALVADVKEKEYVHIKHPYKDNSIASASLSANFRSIHASLAYTATSIFTYFFPENKEEWKKLAEDVIFSRPLSRANYPIEVEGAREHSN